MRKSHNATYIKEWKGTKVVLYVVKRKHFSAAAGNQNLVIDFVNSYYEPTE
jgi:hypothetical protein